MHWCSSGLVLLGILSTSGGGVSAFAPSDTTKASTRLRHGRQRRQDTTVVPLHMTLDPANHSNRRKVLQQSAAGMLLGLSSLVSSPTPAHAKKKEMEAKTPENVQAAFDALDFELNNQKGGIRTMQDYIDKEDFTGLLEFTKTYDQVLRKGKWARCKAFMNNAEQEVATLQGNAVTFDLIGINRSSRSGQESVEKANKYLQELRVDLQGMMDMQTKIQFEGDGSFEDYYQSIRGK